MAKRKVRIENRQFQKSWETDYFFINCGGQPQCLLCKKKLANLKKSNVSRHYNTCHKEKYDKCSTECRVEILRNLKQEYKIENETQGAEVRDLDRQQSIAASYAVALEIARAKKSFCDGELIKKCAIEMAKAFRNENAIECFGTVSLSRQTISEQINGHIENKLKILLEKCICYKEIHDTCSTQFQIETVNSSKQQYKTDNEINSLNTFQQQSVAASYAVALEIARAKKSFCDGELIKKCTIEMAKSFGNENVIESFETVSLSRQTIAKRISEINGHIENKLKILLEKCRYFSLCLNESMDVMNTSQVSIFVRIIDNDFFIHEELLALISLYSIKGIDIFNVVCEQVEKYGGFSKCSAILMDGRKTMIDQEIGFRGLLKKKEINCPTFHCIMHQETLCGEVLMLSSTMKIIIKVINLIRSGNGSLSHKKFQAFLQDENLCWLGTGETLKHFFNLREDILEFLQKEANTNTKDIQENFKEIKFLSELAFLTDIASHLNHLNSQLKEQNHTISDLIGYVNGFQNKLKLFIIELEANELHHFPSCEEIAKCHSNVNFLMFRLPLLEIQEQFHRCFKDFDLLKNDLQIFNNPKGCVIKEQEIAYRLELCNLQADPFLLSRNKYGLEFFKLLSQEKYPKLIDLGLKICSMFGSTYKCESSLSVMKYIKSKYRAMLTEESLCSLLRLATSTISVDIPSLVNRMSHPQFSH
ncbi:hypothetical protein V1478_010907 [Vespula squamosa]|uniref:SPIN-DOC-like zinc-finger domain-containing protein n=1 Tax=Vespula squamosa TaxID=30214 RepID=A0ABD2AFY7_VESSQ